MLRFVVYLAILVALLYGILLMALTHGNGYQADLALRFCFVPMKFSLWLVGVIGNDSISFLCIKTVQFTYYAIVCSPFALLISFITRKSPN
jgi:hypothetical protein